VCGADGALASEAFDRIVMNPAFGEKIDPKLAEKALGLKIGSRSETALTALALHKLAPDFGDVWLTSWTSKRSSLSHAKRFSPTALSRPTSSWRVTECLRPMASPGFSRLSMTGILRVVVAT
jgi:hypothetical protein